MVPRLVSRVRKPVKREGAERYLLLTLLSFAASVSLTRLFLEISGYPQLARGEFHIAHVLWGGLCLFVAALLPLIFSNRWSLTLGALLAGLGVGLFIDEVGKFITQNNEYFHPAAAPIVYATFLVTVLVYFHVRRSPEGNPRGELYRAIDAIAKVIDHDLEPSEHRALRARLVRVSRQAQHPDLRRLAEALLSTLESEALHLAPETPGLVRRMHKWLREIERRWVTARRLKALLAGGLMALSLEALVGLGQILWSARDPAALSDMVARWVALGQVTA